MSGGFRVFVGGAQRRVDPRHQFGRQLQARDHPGAAAHRREILVRGAPHLGVAQLRLRRDPRHVDHEARIDPVIAGRDALAAVGADLRPALGLRRPGPARQQVEDAVDDRGALAASLPRSIPAGSTIGHAATHLPQRVQASSMSSTRLCTASRNSDPPDFGHRLGSSIGARSPHRPPAGSLSRGASYGNAR